MTFTHEQLQLMIDALNRDWSILMDEWTVMPEGDEKTALWERIGNIATIAGQLGGAITFNRPVEIKY